MKISKDLICPSCKEIWALKFRDYKICLNNCINNCINNHVFSNILLEQFDDFQKIDESKILCNNCINSKKETYNSQFYKCFTCNNNICPTWKLNHEQDHKILDYEQKNFFCNEYGEKLALYCNDCNKNLCESYKSSCNEHKVISFNTIIKNQGYNNINKLKLKINNFLKDEINDIIKKFNKIISNLEIYYNIS